MNSFKNFLLEEIAAGSVNKVSVLIQKYINKKLKIKSFKLPGIERWEGQGKGFGIRLFLVDGRSLRFNWSSAGINAFNLSSLDIWFNEKEHYRAFFDKEVSLVKVLPLVAEWLQKGVIPGKFRTKADGIDLNESADENMKMLNAILNIISTPGFTKNKVWKVWKGTGVKVFEEIEEMYPDLLYKSGRKYIWDGTAKDIKKILASANTIFDNAGMVRGNIKKVSGKEKIKPSDQIAEFEANMERLSFEDQLHDLENLVKMTVSGASNALFVAGKGGIGKTYTVEKMLHSMGMSDGRGYFKNTGSASAAGVYALLFKYNDSIIFFDDSDDALKDQQARNIFKAATDTKKVRKLVWNKMGKNIVDPDEEDMTPEEMLEKGLLPRHFEFTGRIIFISNLSINKLDPDGAIRTRAFLIEIDPTTVEIYDFMEKIVDKIDLEEGLNLSHDNRVKVVGLLRSGKSKQSANLRKLSRGLNMMAGAEAAGVSIPDAQLKRMIEFYA